ncbi:hypothetical protein [Desulfovibrio sp.]|uniref:hypothetical protein n=1 Tax=Desulfovibrio sp. TaxID=885 RepID=UPI0025B9C0F6|nr:hypothetical protein [Desulfovibrio sp.]
MKKAELKQKNNLIELKTFFWTKVIGLCAVTSCIIYVLSAIISFFNYIETKNQNDVINNNSLHIGEFKIDTSNINFINLDLSNDLDKEVIERYNSEIILDGLSFENDPDEFFSRRNKDLSLKITNTGNVALRDITIDFIFSEDLCGIINDYFENRLFKIGLSISKEEIIYSNKKFYSTYIFLLKPNLGYGVPSFYSEYVSILQKGDVFEYKIPQRVCLLFGLLRIVSDHMKNMDNGFNGMIKLRVSYIDEKNNFKNLYFDFFNKNNLTSQYATFDGSHIITLLPILKN